MQLFRPCEQHLVRALATIRDQRVEDDVLLGHAHQVLHVVDLGRVPRIELLLHAKGHAVTCCTRLFKKLSHFRLSRATCAARRTMPKTPGVESADNFSFLKLMYFIISRPRGANLTRQPYSYP